MTGQIEKDEKAGIEQHVVRFFQSDGHEYASSASSAESQEREKVASLPLRIKRWFQRTQSPAQEHQEKRGLDTAAEEPNLVSKVKGIFKKSPADHADHRSSTAAITRTPTTSDSTGSRSTSVEENIVTKPSQAHFPWYQGGVRLRHIRVLRFVGRCGFIAKGIIYGIIGVLTCTNVTGAWTPNGSNSNESPQGAFLLLGGIPGVGRPILVVMAIGLVMYIIWRFWEAFTGQGTDGTMSNKANFFRYRLSPFVSGCVYAVYSYYIFEILIQASEEEQQQKAASDSFPQSWDATALGRAGLGLLGIAFIIATITQVMNAITGNFAPDMRPMSKWEMRILMLLGRIGFAGRALTFGTLSGLFWDTLANPHQDNASGRQNMVAKAISKLADSGGGRFFMMLLGITLVIYAVFAVANAYYKLFPTPPPSRQPKFESLQNDEHRLQAVPEDYQPHKHRERIAVEIQSHRRSGVGSSMESVLSQPEPLREVPDAVTTTTGRDSHQQSVQTAPAHT